VAIIGALVTAASLGEMTSMYESILILVSYKIRLTVFRYPTAGGQYHFTAKLAPERCRNFLSWLVGWIGKNPPYMIEDFSH
jgi:hypothetical protein